MVVDRSLMERVASKVVPGARIEHLGTGGFASTFKVTPAAVPDQPPGTSSPYALKIVDSAQSDAERSERELAALQRVSHPNVVAYRETGTVEHEGVVYRWLSMDYVEGFTLGRALREGTPWTRPAAVNFLRQLVGGAAAIWEQQTAHRDLSPNNILITNEARPVIVDLGLARHLDDTTITTLPTPGTPGWMSPEQVGANPSHGDWRSDQFVLGIIGYRLVTGTAPFTYHSPAEAWVAPHAQNPRPPRDLDPTIPVALSDLVMKMLAKKPHRRFLRPEALLAELDRVAAALAVTEDTLEVQPNFYLVIGDNKGYAAVPEYLRDVAPEGVIIEPRTAGRVTEFMSLTSPEWCTRLSDPVTHFARSPSEHRPAYYRELPYGRSAQLFDFSRPDEREAFCAQVLDHQLDGEVDVVMAPYFYAANGEREWIEEALQCAQVTAELLIGRAPQREGVVESVWTGVAVHSSWLGQEARRDELMTLLTSQPIGTLHLLIGTTQNPFATLGDLRVLQGLADLLSVMREAGVPVVLGRRGPEGLLGLALGAAGWGTGVRAVQQNMNPHPESDTTGGPGQDRVYVPQLLSTITAGTYQQFLDAAAERVTLETPYAQQLLADNPALESLSSEERYLLLQHNAAAARQQAATLAGLAVPARTPHLRAVVEAAREHFAALPAMSGPGESSTFLDSWLEVL
jgi:serine/threonine protein kinase